MKLPARSAGVRQGPLSCCCRAIRLEHINKHKCFEKRLWLRGCQVGLFASHNRWCSSYHRTSMDSVGVRRKAPDSGRHTSSKSLIVTSNLNPRRGCPIVVRLVVMVRLVKLGTEVGYREFVRVCLWPWQMRMKQKYAICIRGAWRSRTKFEPYIRSYFFRHASWLESYNCGHSHSLSDKLRLPI